MKGEVRYEVISQNSDLPLVTAAAVWGQGAGTAINYKKSAAGASFSGFCSPDFGFTSAMTITAWVKWDTASVNPDQWANICSNNSYSQRDVGQFWLQHASDNRRFEFALKTVNSRSYVFASNTKI